MIILKKLTVIDIFTGEPVVYIAGECGLLSIQFIGNSTHQLIYEDKSVLFIRTKDYVSEGTQEKRV